MNNISFDCTYEEHQLIVRILNRAKKLGYPVSYPGTEMDIVSTHCNGTPLNLKLMLKAPTVDLFHDLSGIARYIDRTTGKLQNLFSPRCAMRGEPHVQDGSK